MKEQVTDLTQVQSWKLLLPENSTGFSVQKQQVFISENGLDSDLLKLIWRSKFENTIDSLEASY